MARQLKLSSFFGGKRKRISDTDIDDGDCEDGESVSVTVTAAGISDVELPGPSESSESVGLGTSGTGSSTSSSKPKAKKGTRSFRDDWRKDFEWIKYDRETNKMFCSVCQECPGIADNKTSFISGCQSFKRETLNAHAKSKAHIKCVENIEARRHANQQPLARAARRMRQSMYAHLTVLFNTAYYVGKQNKSFAEFTDLCALQRKNKIQVNEQYVNDKQCAEFIGHISAVLKKEKRSNLKDEDDNNNESIRPFSIICDSSTDRALLENCNIYVRYVSSDDDMPKTMLWEVATLSHANADGYLDAVKKSIGQWEEWDKAKEHLVALGSDGASVMSSRAGGLNGKLNADIEQDLVFVHCAAHREQLALSDAWKGSYMDTFDTVMKNIYSFYHRSPKKTAQLQELADVCELTVNRFHTIHSVRWVASKQRAAKALLKNLEPTIMHLQNIGSSSDADAATARGLLKHLTSYKFVGYLHFVCDYLSPLENLSVNLQSDDAVAPKLDTMVNATIVCLEALSKNPGSGSHCSAFLSTTNEDNNYEYKGFKLTGVNGSGHRDFLDDAKDTTHATITALKRRMFENENEIIRACRLFDPQSWAAIPDELELINTIAQAFAHHAGVNVSDTTELKQKCQEEWNQVKLNICSYSIVHQTYQNVKDHILWNNRYPVLGQMLKCAMVMPVSSACCERGFSAITRIKDAYRTCLQPETLDNLMQLRVNGPSLEDFEPEEAIEHWFWKTDGVRHVRGHKKPRRLQPDGPAQEDCSGGDGVEVLE